MPKTKLPPAPTPSTPANSPAVRHRQVEEQSLLSALSVSEVDGSIVAAAELLEMDKERAKKIVTKALARTLKLPEVQGNIAAAAAKLGLNYMTAYKLCMKNNFLSAMHPSKDPDQMTVDQLDTIARSAILTADEIREIEASSKQDSMLSAGDFAGLGLNDSRIKDLMTLERFAQRPITNMIDLTHGGQVYCFLELVDILKKYKKKLDSGDLPAEFDQQGEEVNKEREWVMTLVSVSAEIRQINNQVQRTNLIRLKAKELDKEKKDGVAQERGKPGFSPMVAVQVNTGGKPAEVNVSERPNG